MSWMFSQASPFYGICEQAANFILMNGTYRVIEKGEVLYRAGDYVDGYFAVLEGEIHLQHTDERAIKHSLWPRRKGHWFAYVHHFAGHPAPADAIAYKKTKLLHVSTSLSAALFKNFPELYHSVLKDVTQEYVGFAEYHKCTVSNTLHARVARQIFIMSLEAGSYEISCTHAELASYVGATREAVGAQLKVLVEEKLIETKYKKIEIINPSLMSKLAFDKPNSFE